MSGLRAPRAGSLRECQAKVDASFDCDDAKLILKWIKSVTGQQIEITDSDAKCECMDNFYVQLKDGFNLCLLVNAFLPDSAKLNFRSKTFLVPSNPAFAAARERERIEVFLERIKDLGVTEQDCFQTDCLYERTNLPKVISCVRVFGIEVESQISFAGPRWWPRKSEANPRHFSEETLRASHNVISLQYGTNKGASQAGMNFGKKRMILKD